MSNGRPPTVVAMPKHGIPYNENFYSAVEAAGGTVVEGTLAGRWLLQNLKRGDFVHLHWPAFSYADPSLTGLVIRFLRLSLLLVLIRAKGCHVLWTAHNLLPHDAAVVPALDIVARRVLIRLCYRIFVHGSRAATMLIERFPGAGKKIVTIEHGHWIDYYPRTVTRAEARKRLNLDEANYVYLFIGLCKEYKNIEALIRAFAALSTDAVLLIAGKFQSASYQATIEALAKDVSGVRVYPGYIADVDLQTYLVAADVVVAPYQEVLTSGTAVLALSFGRPIVSIRRGCLIDLITEETGLLYDPNDASRLQRALAAVRELTFDEDVILSRARKLDWRSAARVFLSALDIGESA